ncbi:MAG: hypothetical protein AAGJ95_05610 [Cyanobacteria bacterium J06554_11]
MNTFVIGTLLAAIGASVASGAIAHNGFSPVENFPHRDTSYDMYLPAGTGTINNYQFSTLYNHIAFPQSRGALTGLLGHPKAYSGSYDYYSYNGSEVAVYYTGDTALFFTVGY